MVSAPLIPKGRGCGPAPGGPGLRPGRLRDVDEAYARRSGYRREQLLGISLADLEASESAVQAGWS
jgi:hypothetical protein